MVIVTEPVLDLVLLPLPASRGQFGPRLPPLGIAVWLSSCVFPEISEASHARVGSYPDISREAVRTVQVTTEHAERKRIGAGKGVEERFLLDRVALEGADVATWHHQRATAVVADLADPAQAVLDQALVSARVATDLVVRQLLVERSEG